MDHIAMYTARKAAKMTQAELAEVLGVNRATVSKYETGVIVPSIEQIFTIADVLKISVLELLGIRPETDSEEDHILLIRLLKDYAKEHGNVDASILSKVYYFDENGLRFREDDSLFERLVNLFDNLNEAGQIKALEWLEELSEIPKYKK